MHKKILSVFVAFIAVLSVAAFPVLSSGADDEEVRSKGIEYRGIDVSRWQGEIDFEPVREAGIRAVYIEAGEGTDIVDPYFERNYEKSREAGLKYGFYHYVTARSEEEAVAQADFFANLIRHKPQDMRAAMDFENLSGLTAEEAVSIAKAYLERLGKRLGHIPAVYSDSYDARTVWKSELREYPLWVADYGVSEPSDIGGWSNWSGFQYSDRGLIRGISGHVDLDLFRDHIFLTEDEQRKGREIRRDYCIRNEPFVR